MTQTIATAVVLPKRLEDWSQIFDCKKSKQFHNKNTWVSSQAPLP